MRYYHRDNLGSVSVITNEGGGQVERLGFEAFGERRSEDGSPQDRGYPINALATERGYTGHEHLDELNLIHMNGRVFDPVLGRFMVPDPVLQDPANLQSYNRYGYCFNNPMICTDPSGYKFNLFKAAVVVAAAVFTAGAVSAWMISSATSGFLAGSGLSTAFVTIGGEAAVFSALGGALAGAAGGFAAAFVGSGGDFNAGAKGAFSGALFGAIGAYGTEQGWGTGAFTAAHAGAGCLSGAASGGGCGPGALSAGAGKFATLGWAAHIEDPIALGIAVTAIGGTASVLGGGKFGNGATTAAFGYLFNCGLSKCWKSYGRIAAGLYTVKEAAGVCAISMGAGCGRLLPAIAVGVNMVGQGIDGVLRETNDGTNFAVEHIKRLGNFNENEANTIWAGVEIAGASILLNTNVAAQIQNYVQVLPNGGVSTTRVIEQVKSFWETLGKYGKAGAAGGMIYDAVSPTWNATFP